MDLASCITRRSRAPAAYLHATIGQSALRVTKSGPTPMCRKICCKTVDTRAVTRRTVAYELADFVLAWRRLAQPDSSWDTLKTVFKTAS
jgi:hypothetical protein